MIKAILERFAQLHPKEIDLSLDRLNRLLKDLGHPESKLPPVVHIAGTNGKGSTLASIRALFEANNQNVHAYTSPHLVRFAERIRLAGTLPKDSELIAILEHVESINQGQAITFFEVTTAAAFYAFALKPADICLLETGLGGRLDATNVVPTPAVTILTPIAYDHQDYLGNSLTEIATEKAHIMRSGVPTVVAKQPDEALDAILTYAKRIGAPVLYEGRDWSFQKTQNGGVQVKANGLNITTPPLALIGDHQIANTALAIVAAHTSGLIKITKALLERAIPNVNWAGRLQCIRTGNVIEKSGQPLWLDGGHNPAAAEVIAPVLAQWQANGPVDIILGMQTTKDPVGYLQQIAPYIRNLATVPVPGAPAPMDAKALAQTATQAGCSHVTAHEHWQNALTVLCDQSDPTRTLLISGSLYLVGDVLAANGDGSPD